MNQNEILNSHFNENEHSDVIEKINLDDSFKEKYEKIQSDPNYKMAQLEERISKTDETFDRRFKDFKKAVLEAEKKQTNLVEDAKAEAEKKLKDKKDQVISELKEQADKKIPFIGGFLFDWARDLMKPVAEDAKTKDKFFASIGKSFGGFILSMLGLKAGFESLKDMKVEEVTEPIKATVKKVTTGAKKAVEDLKDGDEGKKEKVIESKENFDNKVKSYGKMGRFFIKEMGGEEFNTNNNLPYMFDAIGEKGIKYNELKEYSYDKVNGIEEKDKDNFEKAKKSILSNEMEIIFNSIITEKTLLKLKEKEHTNKILEKIGVDENINWKSIELSNLFILLGLCLGGITTIALKQMEGFGTDVVNKILDFRGNNSLQEIKEDIKSDIEKFESEILPKDLGSIFLNSKFNTVKSFSLNKESLTLELKKEGLKGDYEIYIDKIIKFRDFVKENIIKNEKYSLGESEEILKYITINNVIQLYILFGSEVPNNGKIDDTFNSALIYPWIIKILDNNSQQGTYIARLGDEIDNNNSDKLSNGERKLIKVLLKKVIDEGIVKSIIKGAKITKDYVIENPEEVASIGGILYLINLIPQVRSWRFISKAYASSAAVASYLYYQLNSDIQEEVKKHLSIDIMDKIEEEHKKKQSNLEYKKLEINKYSGNTFEVEIKDLKSSPVFTVKGDKYDIDVGPTYEMVSFPDKGVNSNAYFVEKNGIKFIQFERKGTGSVFINLSDLDNKINKNIDNLDGLVIHEDFFIFGNDAYLIKI